VDEEIKKHSVFVMEKIKKFLSGEKPADVLIIKSHLLCEYYLNQILIIKGISEAKEIDKLTFFDKNNKAFDLNITNQKNIHNRLSRLNKLRNKIGHELEYSLSEYDVDSLGHLTGKKYILDKYDFNNIEDLLRNTLIIIVIDVAFFVSSLVSVEKVTLKITSLSNK
jgi:hypothetical protein